MTMRKRGPFLLRFTPWAVFGVSFALCLATAWLAARIGREQTTGRFMRAADDIGYVVSSRLNANEALLRSTEAMIATMPSSVWSRERFRQFVHEIDLPAHYPGVQGIGFAAVFAPEEVQGLFGALSAEGGPRFSLTPAPNGREPLSSILYLEPQDARNRAAMGFDMLSEPLRREAMLRARDTGKPALSGAVRLIQETSPSEQQPGFLMYMPVYDLPRAPATLAERRATLRGFVYTPFRAHDFFRATFRGRVPDHVGFRVYDDGHRDETLLYSSIADASAFAKAKLRTEEHVAILGRTWSIEIITLPGFVSPVERVLPVWIVVLGGLASGLLWFLTRSQLAARIAIQEGLTAIARGEAQRAELAEQRALARRDALEKAALVDALFEAAPAGLAVVDARRMFVRVNDALERLTGVAMVTLLGHGFEDVLDASDPAIDDALSRAITRGEVVTTEASVRVRGVSTERTWLMQVAPVHVSDERRAGIAVIVLDITERKQMERDLADANRELDQFAYVASHDLKAPLRGIGHLVEWLAEDLGDDVPDVARDHMRAMRARVTRLEGLIDGILHYARAGRKSGSRERIDVEELVREVVTLLALPARAKVVVVTPLPELTTERAPLAQVLMNLIGNALKHAGRDDVRIEIGARDLGASYELFVRDNGPGIAPEDVERIWGVFQTGRASAGEPGTGIGLAVVRRIVEARGGRTQVDSELGKGATFSFTWPKHEGSADDVTAPEAALLR